MVHLLFFPEKLVQRGTCSPIRDPGLKESLGHLIYKHRNSFSKVRYFLFQFLLNVFMGNSPLPNPPASFANQFWGPENAAISHTKAPSCPRYIPMGEGHLWGSDPPSLPAVCLLSPAFISFSISLSSKLLTAPAPAHSQDPRPWLFPSRALQPASMEMGGA